MALACLFALFWLAMMTASIAGMGCGKDRLADDRRLRLCNVSLSIPLPPGERGKGSGRYLERGIILSRMGRLDMARADFSASVAGRLRNAGAARADLRQ